VLLYEERLKYKLGGGEGRNTAIVRSILLAYKCQQLLHKPCSIRILRVARMAEAGVSAEALKGKIQEQLQAVHVEIEDMSGMHLEELPRHYPSMCLRNC
jgi:hypothetical protein